MVIKVKSLSQPIKAAPMPAYVSPIAEPAKRRGRPPSGKVRVHIMLNPATVEAFKAGGRGWQQRISDALDAEAADMRRSRRSSLAVAAADQVTT